MQLILTYAFLIFTIGAVANEPNPSNSGMVSFLKEYLNIKYSDLQFDDILYVAVKQQKMYYIKGNHVLNEYSVSTAKNGLGSQLGSQKTPAGLHLIREKVGGDVPYGGIIKEKVYTGEVATVVYEPKSTRGDQITTRLFHLDGLEPGINKTGNCDSYSRGIMIHGTPEEGLIGQPVSHGCVRMKNSDIEELFELVEAGTKVIILNN